MVSKACCSIIISLITGRGYENPNSLSNFLNIYIPSPLNFYYLSMKLTIIIKSFILSLAFLYSCFIYLAYRIIYQLLLLNAILCYFYLTIISFAVYYLSNHYLFSCIKDFLIFFENQNRHAFCQ